MTWTERTNEAWVEALRSSRPTLSDAAHALAAPQRRRLLAAAEELYVRSDAGLARLPAACRPGMFAARRLYAEIGREVQRRGLDSVNGRAIVSWQRKSRVLSEALVAAAGRYAPNEKGSALPEATFLVESVTPAPPVVQQRRVPWPRIEDRVVWLIDLFERLEQRDHVAGRSLRSLPAGRQSPERWRAAYGTAAGIAPTSN